MTACDVICCDMTWLESNTWVSIPLNNPSFLSLLLHHLSFLWYSLNSIAHSRWGIVHTDKFWRENARLVELDEFKLLKLLIALLGSLDSVSSVLITLFYFILFCFIFYWTWLDLTWFQCCGWCCICILVYCAQHFLLTSIAHFAFLLILSTSSRNSISHSMLSVSGPLTSNPSITTCAPNSFPH